MTPPHAQTRRLEVSLADLVTTANAICGFLAIAVAARLWTGVPGGELRLSDDDVLLAAGLIVAGGLLDSVDGAVARWKGSSALGEHLELMSDAVTFGLAPAMLFVVDAASYQRPWSGLALVVGAAYAAAVLLRLARYASVPPEGGKRGLVGLPSPPSAMAAISLVVLHPPAPVALACMAALTLLLVASFPFPRIGGMITPVMVAWWAFAGVTATRVIPAWPVASFTLTLIGGLLLVILARHVLRGRRPAAQRVESGSTQSALLELDSRSGNR